MTKKAEHTNGTVEKRKFVVDPDFKDPLIRSNMDEFQEIEVEEIKSYYKVFLGIPMDDKEVLTNK